MRLAKFLLLAIGIGAAGACMESAATHHTLYLTPRGEAAWAVLDRDARSTERNSAERQAEEREYLERATAGEHLAALGFRLLEPSSVDHRVLRHEVPYTVYTEARYDRVDVLARNLFARLEIPAEVSLTTDPDRRHSTLTIHCEPSLAPEELAPEIDPLVALFFTAEDHRLVLTEGRFIEALGFELIEDGRAARLDERIFEQGVEPVILRLTWSLDEA